MLLLLFGAILFVLRYSGGKKFSKKPKFFKKLLKNAASIQQNNFILVYSTTAKIFNHRIGIYLAWNL